MRLETAATVPRPNLFRHDAEQSEQGSRTGVGSVEKPALYYNPYGAP